MYDARTAVRPSTLNKLMVYVSRIPIALLDKFWTFGPYLVLGLCLFRIGWPSFFVVGRACHGLVSHPQTRMAESFKGG